MKDNDQNHATAIHEAGHVMMVIILGMPWRSATVNPLIIGGRTALGIVSFLKPENTDNLIRILLAGYAAEQVAGLPISYGAKVEYNQCRELAKQTDEDPEGWTRALLWQVETELKKNKKQLGNLASFLKWMKTITPETVNHVSQELDLPHR